MNTHNPPPPPDWKLVVMVVGSGALGGLLAWIYAISVGEPPEQTTYWIVPAWSLLGMGASFIGVYLIANTDTRYTLRCLAFAIVCGFSWQPIYEAGRALVDKHIQEESTRQLKDITEKAGVALTTFESAEGEAKTVAMTDLTDLAGEVLRRSHNVSDYDARTGAHDRSRQIVDAIALRSKDMPKEATAALNELTTTAIAANQDDVAEYAIAALTKPQAIPTEREFGLEYIASLAHIEKSALAAANVRLALLARRNATERTLVLANHVGTEWTGWRHSPYSVGEAYTSLNNLALLYKNLGDDTAATATSAALRTYRKSLADNPKMLSLVLSAVSDQCMQISRTALPDATEVSSKRYADALRDYEKALKLLRTLQDDGSTDPEEGDTPNKDVDSNETQD